MKAPPAAASTAESASAAARARRKRAPNKRAAIVRRARYAIDVARAGAQHLCGARWRRGRGRRREIEWHGQSAASASLVVGSARAQGRARAYLETRRRLGAHHLEILGELGRVLVPRVPVPVTWYMYDATYSSRAYLHATFSAISGPDCGCCSCTDHTALAPGSTPNGSEDCDGRGRKGRVGEREREREGGREREREGGRERGRERERVPPRAHISGADPPTPSPRACAAWRAPPPPLHPPPRPPPPPPQTGGERANQLRTHRHEHLGLQSSVQHNRPVASRSAGGPAAPPPGRAAGAARARRLCGGGWRARRGAEGLPYRVRAHRRRGGSSSGGGGRRRLLSGAARTERIRVRARARAQEGARHSRWVSGDIDRWGEVPRTASPPRGYTTTRARTHTHRRAQAAKNRREIQYTQYSTVAAAAMRTHSGSEGGSEGEGGGGGLSERRTCTCSAVMAHGGTASARSELGAWPPRGMFALQNKEK